MILTIKCDICNKTHTMDAPAKKYLQFRDALERGGFSYCKDAKIEGGKLKEIMIRCECGNFIFLGMD